MCAVTTTNARVLLYTCVAVDICSSWAVGVRAVTTTKAHVLLYTCQLLHISSAVCMCAVATHVLLCTHVNCYTCFTLYTYAVLRLICDVCAVATRVCLYTYQLLQMCYAWYVHRDVTRDICVIYRRWLKLIQRNPPPGGGFLFTMFPDQEPCVRGPPSEDLYQVLRGGSSYTRFLIREHNRKPPGGGGFFRSTYWNTYEIRESHTTIPTHVHGMHTHIEQTYSNSCETRIFDSIDSNIYEW